VKPPPLDYLRPATVDEAIAALAADEDAKVLAGGQSLVPLLALRLARPSRLVDICDLGLEGVGEGKEGSIRVGAGVRQRHLELDPAIRTAVPLLADAVGQVGYPSTRNRGTLGGSLAHADPVAELPVVAAALGAVAVAAGPSGTREIPCAELSTGWFSTVLDPAELLTEVRFPAVAGPRHGAAWREWAPRAHDFATAGVGVALDLDASGTCTAVHAAACGIGGSPLVLSDALGSVIGFAAGADPTALLRSVATAAREAAAGGEEDQVELVGLLAARAVADALASAGVAA